MNNEEKILLLLEKQGEHLERIDSRLDKMDSRLDKMDSRLDNIESRLDNLEEANEITRDGVNALLQWAEVCSHTMKLPLPKVM